MRRLLFVVLCLTMLLIPISVLPAAAQGGTIVDVAGADDRLNTSASAIAAAGLNGYYSGLGPLTVLLPSDDAFRRLSAAQLQQLNANPSMLADILRYHSVLGSLSREQLAAAGTLTSLQGGALTITGNPAGRLVVNGVANIIAGPINTTNGVIYIIDRVLDIMPAAPQVAAPVDTTAVTGLNSFVLIIDRAPIYIDPFTHPGQFLPSAQGFLLCQTTFITELRGGFAKLRDMEGWIPASSFIYPQSLQGC